MFTTLHVLYRLPRDSQDFRETVLREIEMLSKLTPLASAALGL